MALYLAQERRILAEYAKFNTRRLKAPETPDDDGYGIDGLNDVIKEKSSGFTAAAVSCNAASNCTTEPSPLVSYYGLPLTSAMYFTGDQSLTGLLSK